MNKKKIFLFHSLLILTLINFCCTNNRDYCKVYKDVSKKYEFIDSISCISETAIKLYLSFQYSNLEWEGLFCNAFANEIYKTNYTLQKLNLQIGYPKINISVFNLYSIKFPKEQIRLDKLDFENYLVSEFTPSDFYAYSTYLNRMYDYYDDPRFNELFGSLVMNIFISKKLNSNVDDRNFVLDELIEAMRILPKEDPLKLIELKSKLDSIR